MAYFPTLMREYDFITQFQGGARFGKLAAGLTPTYMYVQEYRMRLSFKPRYTCESVLQLIGPLKEAPLLDRIFLMHYLLENGLQGNKVAQLNEQRLSSLRLEKQGT